MTTIGSKWKNSLTLQAASRQSESMAEQERRLLAADIAIIDNRVAIAERLGLGDTRIMTNALRLGETAQDRQLDQLALASRRDPNFTVSARDFAEGSAPRALVEACAPKGLVCLVVRQSRQAPLDEDFYLHARPL